MNVTKMMTITVVWHISFDGIWLVRIDLGQHDDDDGDDDDDHDNHDNHDISDHEDKYLKT